MIANFFQSLESAGVDYLLISGQATVLYGAATFSEDVDLWVEPSPDNVDRFLRALRAIAARYYKLTPALTTGHLLRGHGFHFVFGEGAATVYLDVMGQPPRAGEFAVAEARACRIPTEWGPVDTVGIRELVELKKTQRLEDYPIISKLALAWFDQPECRRSSDEIAWAAENIFTLPELEEFLVTHPEALEPAGKLHPSVGRFGRLVVEGRELTESVEQPVREWLQARVAVLQAADRNYWRPIIAELKALRGGGQLMPEGAFV